MTAAGLISERVSDLVETEAAIHHGLEASGVNCSNEVPLMLAAAN
jgi:hypothetical protein